MQYTVDQIAAIVADLPLATANILLRDLIDHVLNGKPLETGTVAYIQLSAEDIEE